MTIRPATVADAAVIANVRARSWQAAYRGVVPDTVLDTIDENRSTAFWAEELGRPRSARQHTLVADTDDGIAGFASGGPTRDADDHTAWVAEVYTIYVLPAVWRAGIGTALLNELAGRLAATGFGEATLWVLEENPRGRAFYGALGWAPDGCRRTITIGTPLVEIRYRIRLAAPRPAAWP